MFINEETLEMVQQDVMAVFEKYKLSNGEIMSILDSIKTFEMASAIIEMCRKNKEK